MTLMSSIGSMLRSIAHLHALPILVTNHTTTAGGGAFSGNSRQGGGAGKNVDMMRDAWAVGGVAGPPLGHAKWVHPIVEVHGWS